MSIQILNANDDNMIGNTVGKLSAMNANIKDTFCIHQYACQYEFYDHVRNEPFSRFMIKCH